MPSHTQPVHNTHTHKHTHTLISHLIPCFLLPLPIQPKFPFFPPTTVPSPPLPNLNPNGSPPFFFQLSRSVCFCAQHEDAHQGTRPCAHPIDALSRVPRTLSCRRWHLACLSRSWPSHHCFLSLCCQSRSIPLSYPCSTGRFSIVTDASDPSSYVSNIVLV